MRLLHTSDWHLGQTFHGHERFHEHQRFLDWLTDTLESEAIDALLVAGDVFDNANPSAASQKQLYRFLTQAKRRVPGLNVVLIAGNHDSPGRLEAPAPLLDVMDVAVVGQARRMADGRIDGERLVVPLKTRSGATAAWCLAVPFLRPGDLPRVETEGDAYAEGVALLYRQALEVALSRRQPGQAIVAMGHCHMLGGQVSEESERRIVIGGAEALSDAVFGDCIAYGALGHLHLAQAVPGRAHLRYAGSPLPMSFSETGYPHQVVRIDLEGERAAGITPIRVPRTVGLLRVPAEPAPVQAVLEALAALDLPDVPEESRPYLLVRVSLDAPEPGLRARIDAALEGKPVRLARIETSAPVRAGAQPEAAPMSLDDLSRLQPDTVFRRLYAEQFGGGEVPPEIMSAFAGILHAPIGESAE